MIDTALSSESPPLVGEAGEWHVGRGRVIRLDGPVIMGILNVTPDSFSDGGAFLETERAVQHAKAMYEAGATIIDIGGESTRPGASRVSASEQIRRVIPVIECLGGELDVAISVDTTRAEVARESLQAGAHIVNDVSAGDEDHGILDVAAEFEAGLVLMHRLVPPNQDSYSDAYDQPPVYEDLLGEVQAFLASRVELVTSRGVEHQRIVVDPGLGFGKTVEQNVELVVHIASLGALGCPVLSAASRKSFIGHVSGVSEPADRLAGSLAVSVAHYLAGVRLFRVHDVAAHHQSLEVARHIASVCNTS